MALPASGAITMLQIQTEFGGASPIGINEYYGAAAGIPASGTIAMSDFHGTSAATVSISNALVQASGVNEVVTAKYELKTNGSIYPASIGNWITPTSAAPSDYQCRATLTLGTLTSGTTGSWLALTTARSWTRNAGPGEYYLTRITVEIRKGTGPVLDSAVIEIEAESDEPDYGY